MISAVVQFEARGVEPLEYDFRAGWNLKAAHSSTVFENIDMNGEESYVDYDTEANEPVGIFELSNRFVKL